MAQQHDLPGDILINDNLDSRGYAIGLLISRLFHPILLNVVTFLIIGYYALETHVAGLKWAGICILVQVLPPTVFYTFRLRQGAYSDEDVSVRHERHELYAFGLISVLFGVGVLKLIGVPHQFLALLVAAFLMGLIGGLINMVWKISVHAASIALTATVALLFSRGLGVLLWLCALAVGWARVRTGNHTLLQVLAGFGIATAVVLVVFQLI